MSSALPADRGRSGTPIVILGTSNPNWNTGAELLQIADQEMYFEKVATKSENGLLQRDCISERVGVGN
jgi:hypothetical protein